MAKVRYDVKAARHALGLTQEELARALNLNVREIQRWEQKDVKTRPVPQKRFRNRMRELIRDRKLNVNQEAPATSIPFMRRNLPPKSIKTGQPETIGIAPSSW